MPKAWVDAGLLQDGRFLTILSTSSPVYTSRQVRASIDDVLCGLARHLQKNTRALEAACDWINLAFQQPLETGHRGILDINQYLRVFVYFFWKLSNKGENEAVRYLNDERRRFGFRKFRMILVKSDRPRLKKRLPLPLRPGVAAKLQVLRWASARAPAISSVIHTRPIGLRNLAKRYPIYSHVLALLGVGDSMAFREMLRCDRQPSRQRQQCRSWLKAATLSDEVCMLTIILEGDEASSSNNCSVRRTMPGPNVSSKLVHSTQLLEGSVTSTSGCRPVSRPPESTTPKCEAAVPCTFASMTTATSALARNSDISWKTQATEQNQVSSCERSHIPYMQMIDYIRNVNGQPCLIDPSPVVSNVNTFKRPLSTLPPVWSVSRQEVCESFDWFRSYQGGVYFCKDTVKGYLLSAFASCRDCFEYGGRLVISHGGGKAESIHSRSGQCVTEAAGDQLADDKSVRALLTNYRESRPLVLLVDDKYALFPFDLGSKGITYAVLGFYTIAHVWAEYQPANNEQGRVVRYKFAFQWCDGQGEPWWHSDKSRALSPGTNLAQPRPTSSSASSSSCLPGESQSTLSEESFSKAIKVKTTYKVLDMAPPQPDDVYFVCPACRMKTPQVYADGWACLNPECSRFWTMGSGTMLGAHLHYNRRFLQCSSPYLLPSNLRDIRPTPPVPLSKNDGTTYAFTRGWHCRKCGRLSCRHKWEHWECAHCKDTFGLPPRIRDARDFWAQKVPVPFTDYWIDDSAGIVSRLPKVFFTGGDEVQVQTFDLPDGSQIHHIQSITPRGNYIPDTIFLEYQEQASNGNLAFRRWPMRSHKCRGHLLTNYFSQNSGEPYHYVGGTDNTVPFNQAPPAVVKAREFIQIRLHQALGKSEIFNEILSCAYMERQKMAFHSDSEQGLGPLVAGLSLGAPALMHFRVHHKHHRLLEQESRKTIMTFILRHGDILVMDGANIQEYYEHTVVPTNFRIAATARRIDNAYENEMARDPA